MLLFFKLFPREFEGLTTVCVCVCRPRACKCVRERMVNSAREHMRSQDGSYLVEFIHGGNMLSQVILLTSGTRSNARHNSSPWSPQNRFRGRFSRRGNASHHPRLPKVDRPEPELRISPSLRGYDLGASFNDTVSAHNQFFTCQIDFKSEICLSEFVLIESVSSLYNCRHASCARQFFLNILSL